MGYYVSNIIAIKSSGVFSPNFDIKKMQTIIFKIIKEMEKGKYQPNIYNLKSCMSKELTAAKGSYVVIAGVFNYWNFRESSEFSKKLSKEFETEVMHMCHDHEQGILQCQIFNDGFSLCESHKLGVESYLMKLYADETEGETK